MVAIEKKKFCERSLWRERYPNQLCPRNPEVRTRDLATRTIEVSCVTMSGRKKESHSERIARAVANFDHSEEAKQAQRDRIDADREKLGLPPLPRDKPRDEEPPDVPSCDACGKEYSGTLLCSQCKTAFYCSPECQKVAWKVDGHKIACKTMKPSANASQPKLSSS